MTSTKDISSKPRRRRWSHFTESQLVLATLSSQSGTNIKRSEKRITTTCEMRTEPIPHHAPGIVVTPSPVLLRKVNRDTLTAEISTDPSKQLFMTVKGTRQELMDGDEGQSAARNRLEKRSTPRRLFREKEIRKVTNKSKTNMRKSSRSLASKLSVLKAAKSAKAYSKPGTTTACRLRKTKRKGRERRSERERQISRNPWDSLASVCSVITTAVEGSIASKSAPIPKSIVQQDTDDGSIDRSLLSQPSDARLPSKDLKRSPSRNSDISDIPTDLLSVLTPKGLPRKLRTSAQILKEAEEMVTMTSRDRRKRMKRRSSQFLDDGDDEEYFEAEALPPRRIIRRACKDRRKQIGYNEDSDGDEELAKSNLRETLSFDQSTAGTDHEIGFDRKQSSVASPLATQGDRRNSENNIAAEDENSITSSRSLEALAPKEPRKQLPQHDEKELRNTCREKPINRNHLKQKQRTETNREIERMTKRSGRMRKKTDFYRPPLVSPTKGSKSIGGFQMNAIEGRDVRSSRSAAQRKVPRASLRTNESANKRVGMNLDSKGSSKNMREKCVEEDIQQRTKKAYPQNKSEVVAAVSAPSVIDGETAQRDEQNGEETILQRSTSTEPLVQVVSKATKKKKKKHSKKKKSKKKKSKVRFAPLPTKTTTFSVKIRVKTSMDHGRSSPGNAQLVSQAPSLDQATVQAIADQVTQACLMQARQAQIAPTNIGIPVNSKIEERVVPAPTHVQERVLPAPRHDATGNMEKLRDETERKLSNKPFEIDVNCGSSLVSDLTRDRSMRVAISKKRQAPVPDFEVEDENEFDVPMDDSEDIDYSISKDDVGRTSRFATFRTQDKPPGIPSRSIDPVPKHTRSEKRRRRMWNCGDSLAGSSYISCSRLQKGIPTSKRIVDITKSNSPTHAAVRKESPHCDDQRRIAAAKTVPDNQVKLAPNRRRKDETVVTDVSGNVGCGDCEGCIRIFDCMNCDNCLARLQKGELSFKEGTNSDCLRRICHQSSKPDASVATRSHSLCRPVNSVPDQDNLSFISERGSKKRSFKSTKLLSRASRLWSQQHAKRPPSQRTTGSISSVTTMTGMSGLAPKAKKGQRRKGSKKNPLHYLEMPMSTDGSVTSWMESRRSLRALMEYDEADQDWV